MTTPDPNLIRAVVAERRPSMTMALLLALTATVDLNTEASSVRR